MLKREELIWVNLKYAEWLPEDVNILVTLSAMQAFPRHISEAEANNKEKNSEPSNNNKNQNPNLPFTDFIWFSIS